MTIPTCADTCTYWNPTRPYPKPVKELIPFCLACENYPSHQPKPPNALTSPRLEALDRSSAITSALRSTNPMDWP